MEVGFFADIQGYSGVDVYSRNLYKELSNRTNLKHIKPKSFLKPNFLNKLFLNPLQLKKIKTDLIHLTSQDFLAGFFIGTKADKLVVTVHDIFPFLEGQSGPVYSWMAKRYIKNIKNHADKIIAVSNATKDQILKNTDIKPNKIKVIYEGVDSDVFKPVEADLGYGKYFLHVGSELKRKNIPGLMKIFKEIKEIESKVKLVRVGWLKRKTERLLKNLDLKLGEDVIYRESISTRSLVKLYSNAEKLLFPSLGEGFGLPILESLACGTPVIAFNKKPMSELLPKEMLCGKGNLEKFAKKALSYELSKTKCREIAKRFSWEKTAKRTLGVYKDV